MKYTWSRYRGYEVSSKGDKRFSAFYARMRDGRSLEHHYQCDVKGYDPGGRNWRLGKGKPALNNVSREELWESYLQLWQIWADDNEDLMEDLRVKVHSYGNCLKDRFATTEINQAHALAIILEDTEK